jgi:hypothetical protein
MAKQKPVNTWKVHHDGRSVTLNLYMNKDRIRVECPSLELSWEGTDLAEIRERAEAQTRKRMAAVWVPYILLSVKGWTSAGQDGRTLEMQYSYIHVAKLKEDAPDPETLPASAQTERHMHYVHKRVTAKGQEPGYADECGTRHGAPRGIIRDTPEARAGLSQIETAMRALEGKLVRMLEPEMAAAFLGSVASGQFLLTGGAK